MLGGKKQIKKTGKKIKSLNLSINNDYHLFVTPMECGARGHRVDTCLIYQKPATIFIEKKEKKKRNEIIKVQDMKQ